MNRRGRRSAARGSVVVPVLILVVLGAAAAAAMTMVQYREYKASEDAVARARAFGIAEGALDEAVACYANRGAEGFATVTYPQSAAGATWSVTVTRGDADPSMADDMVRFTAVAAVNGVTSRVEAIHQEVTGSSSGVFGVFGANGVTVNSNSWTDSYDSRLGRWNTQRTTRLRSFTYVGANSVVATNGSITMDSNAAVFGDAKPGPGGRVTMASNAIVTGSTTPSTSRTTLPAVTVPVVASSGDWSVKGERSAVVNSGTYGFGTFSAGSNSRITIRGPATLVVANFAIDSNVNISLDTTNGPVTIYATNSFRMDSNTVLIPTSGRPKDASIQFSGSSGTVSIGSNVTVVGTILAPDTTLFVDSNATIEGSIAAGTVRLDSNVAVHFDESLRGDSGPSVAPSYPLVAWITRGYYR